MPAARHPRARHFSASGLFGGLGSFAELEARIAAIDGNKERGDATVETPRSRVYSIRRMGV